MFGRAYIVNTTILSRLIYPCTILKIPDTFLREINKEITNFIFQGTIRNIKKTTLAPSKKRWRYRITTHHIQNNCSQNRLHYRHPNRQRQTPTSTLLFRTKIYSTHTPSKRQTTLFWQKQTKSNILQNMYQNNPPPTHNRKKIQKQPT